MIEPTTLAAFGLVVWLGYVVQTVTGFGSIIVCMTLGALVLPIELVPVLVVPLSLLQNSWIVIRHHTGIAWALLLRRVLPLMAVGVVAGFEIAERVRGEPLRIAFGVLVLVLAVRELYTLLATKTGAPRPVGPVTTVVAMLGAGIVHGIYATGGPLLVYAIGRLDLGKRALRSTLTVVWLVLNAMLTAMMAHRGRVSSETLLSSAWLVPCVPLGLVVGEFVHGRVSERRFKLLLFSLLSVAAISLIVH